MLGRVEPKDVLSLSRPWVNRPHMFAALHLPDGRHHSVFFDRVVRDVLNGNLCRLIFLCVRRGFRLRSLVFDINKNFLPKLLSLSFGLRNVAHHSRECPPQP